MAITTLTGDFDIIAALDDEPNDTGGLTAAALKAKFDEAGNAVQTYVNDTLIPELDAEHLPYQYGVEGGQTIKEALDEAALGEIPDGSITALKLASDSVTTAKIVDENITTDKIADGAVTAAKMETGVAIIVSDSYEGTGTFGESNKTRITFSKGVQPKIVIVSHVVFPAGVTTVIYANSSSGGSSANTQLTVTWTSTYVEWYDSSSYYPNATDQLNASSTSYPYIEIYA